MITEHKLYPRRINELTVEHTIFIVVNALFIAFSVLYLFHVMTRFAYAAHELSLPSAFFLILTPVIFLILHVIKLLRLYIILLEHRIALPRFISIYIMTTFVNLALPFKLGDLYRMYRYGRETQKYPTGLLGILIERVFDSIVLLIILLPNEILTGAGLSVLSIVILSMVSFLIAFYLMFPPTFHYLNKFLIMKMSYRRVIYLLDALEQLNNWYLQARQLLFGRSFVVLLLSFVIWGLEMLVIFFLSHFCKGSFTLTSLIMYFNAAYLRSDNTILMLYTCLGAGIFAVALCVLASRQALRKAKAGVEP